MPGGSECALNVPFACNSFLLLQITPNKRSVLILTANIAVAKKAAKLNGTETPSTSEPAKMLRLPGGKRMARNICVATENNTHNIPTRIDRLRNLAIKNAKNYSIL